MRYLLALPAIYLAGFLWQIGRDSARAVRIRRTRTRALRYPMQQARRRALLQDFHPEDVYYIGESGAARWTVQ